MEKSRSATREKVRNYIPHDLAVCILSKLPLKSLKRFGCVHKLWTLLFENYRFMSIFRNNFISYHHSYYDDTSLMLQSTNRDLYSLYGHKFENIVKLNLPNPFQEEDPFFYVLDSGSITGILCLYRLYDERTVLWNPTIEEFKIIPPSPFHHVSPYQWVNFTLIGFGYDQVRDDYKFIRYVTYYPLSMHDYEVRGISYSDIPAQKDLSDDTLYWEIYSLRSNTWRKLDVNTSIISGAIGDVNGGRLYMNGMCHWWQFSARIDEGAIDLTSFDLVNEMFFTTPIPLNIYSRYIHIMELNGSIAYMSWIFGTTIFDISILGEIGVKESWIKLYSIGPFLDIKRHIGTGKNGDIFFGKENGEIVWYNLRTQMVEELFMKGGDGHILVYKKCLLPFEGVNH